MGVLILVQQLLVLRPYIYPEVTVALVTRPVVLVLVQSGVVALLVEGLSADRALKDVGWTAGASETCTARRPGGGRTPDNWRMAHAETPS